MPSSPAAAAGGGCKPVTGSSWNIGVCTADNGTTVFADLYVNSRGSVGSTCTIYRWIERYNAGGTIQEAKYPATARTSTCTLGHKPSISAPKVSGKWYRQYMWVSVNGSTVLSGTSYWTT